MSDSDHSPTDIITYIGVPLAVLGVLPILYNTFVTLVALSRIKRMLRHSRLTALTRSDVVNRVIEIELPRYAVTPWDRFRHVSEYWSLSPHRSPIPGGSWTTFNWRANAIGVKTQRVEYADQLRQPQVEVAFDELVAYLLDLGAVPDPHGWRLLRNTGLWTPVGCSLMSGPSAVTAVGCEGDDRRREKAALAVAPLDDSDGHLSLSVSWEDHWPMRDPSHLPPYWVQLPPWSEEEEEEEEEDKAETAAEGGSKPASLIDAEPTTDDDTSPANQDSSEKSQTKKKAESIDSAQQEGAANRRLPIVCQITADGLVSALVQRGPNGAVAGDIGSSSSSGSSILSSNADNLYIDHLRASPSSSRTSGIWFASAVTAFGTTNQTILWSYLIPDAILHFSRRETVPCGVLVLLDMCDESSTPSWSVHSTGEETARRRAEELEAFSRRCAEQRAAMQAEARMPAGPQRDAAVRDRMRREAERNLQDVRDRMRGEAARREARVLEALQSPKWDARLVAERGLVWLKSQTKNNRDSAANGEGGSSSSSSSGLFMVDEDADLKGSVGKLLHRMVLDGELAGRVCKMLDLWKAFADNGGMRKSDFTALQEDKTTFALATLVVAVIKDSSGALEGSLSMDLQECLRMWKKVRLG